MKMIRTVLLTAAVGLCFAATALAADIQVTVNKADKTLTLNSSLGTAVHVTALVSPSGIYGTSAELPAQGSITVPLMGDLPAGIDSARCLAGQSGLPGFTPAPEGFYLVSVSAQ